MTQQPKFEQPPEGWDGAVDDYEATVERVTARFAGHMLDGLGVSSGTMLLDVVSGAGVVAVGAARRGADVLATDFSPRMVERLQQRLMDDGVPQVKTMAMGPHSHSTSPTTRWTPSHATSASCSSPTR